MQLALHFRHLRRVYNRPAANVERGVEISVETMTTRLTNKLRLALAVLFRTVTARATPLAGVARVNNYEKDTRESGFVSQKLPQLSETPTTHSCPLRASKPSALTDVRQIFNRQSACAVLRLTNKLFTDTVVRVSSKVSLTASETLLQTTDGARTLAAFRLGRRLVLQGLTKGGVFLSRALNFCAGEGLPVRVGSNVHDAEIYAQDVGRRLYLRLIHVAHRVQVKLALAVNQIYFALAKWQEFSLIFAAHKRDSAPAFRSPERDGIRFETDNPLVIRDRAVFAKRALSFLIKFVGVGDLSDAAHDHLRRKVEGFSRRMIRQFVEMILLEGLRFPSPLTNEVARLIRHNERAAKRERLFFSRRQLEINDQLHAEQYSMVSQVWNIELFLYGRFLARINSGVSAPLGSL